MSSQPAFPMLDDEMLAKVPAEVAEMVKQNLAMLEEMKAEARGSLENLDAELQAVLGAEFDRPSLSVEKEWQAIHFLLTGSPWEGEGALAKAVLGGREIGEDLGYGPARYLTREEVEDVYEALQDISEQEIRSRYLPETMVQNDIYPGAWESTYVEGIVQAYNAMVDYYQAASKDGRAMLQYIL